MTPVPLSPREPFADPGRLIRVPLTLLRFHQAMAEHGPGACPQPIGAAPPPGHIRFRSTSE